MTIFLADVWSDLTSSPKDGLIPGLLLRLGVSFVLGLVVAGLHLRLRGRSGGPPLAGSLTMLAPLITLVVWAIGDDLARAFGLVGVLAIVRFRTVVREPADTVFVLFAVAAGVTSASASRLAVPAVGTLALAVVLLGLELLGPRFSLAGSQRRLVVKVAVPALPAVERHLAEQGLASVKLVGLEVARGGEVVDARFDVRTAQPDGLDRLVLGLCALDGVLKARSFRPRA